MTYVRYKLMFKRSVGVSYLEITMTYPVVIETMLCL